MSPSKWINKSLFDKYVQTKEGEEEKRQPEGAFRSKIVWKTPAPGTADKARVYEGRFLPDKKGNFTKRYYYHMFRSGERWIHYLCPKTYNFVNWCPLCSITSKLYMGTQKDKTAANNYKRKGKHAGNFFVVDDPRDAEIKENEQKSAGNVKIYEFPDKVESKLKSEITDRKEGLGEAIFDPGPEGFNFILKVKSTKTDAQGKSFPDYSDSVFSRKATSLGTDAEIKKIIESTFDLDEYIQNLTIQNETLIAALKAEMLFDMIKEEWEQHMGETPDPQTKATSVSDRVMEEDDIPELTSPETLATIKAEATAIASKSTKSTKKSSDKTPSDDELLAELNSL